MQVKTIKLTGEETKIEFDSAHAFVEINNLSSSEILISTRPGIVRGDNDVIILNGKTIVTIGETSSCRIKTIYASGSGEIQLIGKNFAEHCFKLPASGDSSDVKPVLDFLPHPEGIYAYWDWEYGVTNTSWTDMTNNNVIKCENENTFGYNGDYLCLNKSGLDVNLNIKDTDNVLIYHVIKLTGAGNGGTSRILSDNNVFTEMHNFGTAVFYTLFENGSEQLHLSCSNEGMTANSVAVFAIQNTMDATSLYSFQKDIFITTSGGKKFFASDIYMYGSQYYYKAILLSNGNIFDNVIKDNMAAIYNKYST